MLCEEFSFHLAQDYYWWNPSKLPTPAEWVNVRRIRVKDAINTVWWLSKTPYPKASNKRVLQPYSESMDDLLKNGYKAKNVLVDTISATNFLKIMEGQYRLILLQYQIQKVIAYTFAIAKKTI